MKNKKPMSSKEYVRQGGPVCPFCRSGNIEGGQFDFEGDHVYQNIVCRDCAKEWTDVYTLTRYEPLVVPD